MKIKPFLKVILGNKRGQTAVEYLLMVVVMMSIIIPLLNKMKEKFLDEGALNPDGTCKEAKSLMCFFRRGIGSNYKYYSVP